MESIKSSDLGFNIFGVVLFVFMISVLIQKTFTKDKIIELVEVNKNGEPPQVDLIPKSDTIKYKVHEDLYKKYKYLLISCNLDLPKAKKRGGAILKDIDVYLSSLDAQIEAKKAKINQKNIQNAYYDKLLKDSNIAVK